ncbi:hypothetical protein DdX_10287 [Ditylenchus destructor]|uniref:Uncharacterized protein n=1 Tax=Ditylenchus destructor TaxID=166010 RepID=A0AAD4N164_9BILA|nr:hypothetical protein DdX_10287 [Ditylenchus destructor]
MADSQKFVLAHNGKRCAHNRKQCVEFSVVIPPPQMEVNNVPQINEWLLHSHLTATFLIHKCKQVESQARMATMISISEMSPLFYPCIVLLLFHMSVAGFIAHQIFGKRNADFNSVFFKIYLLQCILSYFTYLMIWLERYVTVPDDWIDLVVTPRVLFFFKHFFYYQLFLLHTILVINRFTSIVFPLRYNQKYRITNVFQLSRKFDEMKLRASMEEARYLKFYFIEFRAEAKLPIRSRQATLHLGTPFNSRS